MVQGLLRTTLVAGLLLQSIPALGLNSVRVIYPPTPQVHAKASAVLPTASPAPFATIAQLYSMSWSSITFADSDHDGNFEAHFYWRDQNWESHYVIMEEQGGSVYTEEYVGADFIPLAAGDLDQDGKADILGQFSYFVQIYESVDVTTYPTQLVWSSPALSNFEGATTIGDTDRDGRMEIIHSVNGSGSSLYIFENTGDNTYAQVFAEYTGPQQTGEKVVADLDGDGLIEIAFCGLHGWFHVYESPADNTWIETYRDTTGLRNAYAAVGGVDTDGNGVPELFVAGEGDADFRKQTIVYEAVGDNQFAKVAILLTDEFGAGGAGNVLANLESTGIQYVTEAANQLVFYEATGIGQWTVCAQMSDPSGLQQWISSFDVNRNGRSELFWQSFTLPTLVLEHQRTSSVGPADARRLEPLVIMPNPCRIRATVIAPAVALQAKCLAVYDVAGRLVDRRSLRPGEASWVWDAQALSRGVYFLQLEKQGGTPLARGRATIVR